MLSYYFIIAAALLVGVTGCRTPGGGDTATAQSIVKDVAAPNADARASISEVIHIVF